MRVPRRVFLQSSLGAGLLAALPAEAEASPPPDEPVLRADRLPTAPVKITALELLRNGRHHFVRATAADGAVGVAVTNERVRYLYPILQQLVMPYFVGKDAR